MSKFQIWDVPSASLVDETDDIREIAHTVQALIDEDGLGVLNDLSLSEEHGKTGQFISHTGSDITHFLYEHLGRAVTIGPVSRLPRS